MTLLDKLDAIETEVCAYLYNRNFPVYQTCNDVWGKYIVRLVNNNEERHELENWYITVVYNDKLNITDITQEFITRVEEFEREKTPKNPEQYTCHQLCDWQFLRGEDGLILRDLGPSIINNNNDQQITLVKYAKILKNLEE